MRPTYKCIVCGKPHKFKSFWKWLITPHIGTQRYIKCEHCGAERHLMKPVAKRATISFELTVLAAALMYIVGIAHFCQGEWVLGAFAALCGMVDSVNIYFKWRD